MVKYKNILKVIEDNLNKTHLSIEENRKRLQQWTTEEKKTLFKYGVPNYDEKEYDKILKEGTDEEIWEYERQIITNLTKGRQDNIITHLTQFNEEEYNQDEIIPHPQKDKGTWEALQEETQESKGYNDEIIEAINGWWCGGMYIQINNTILVKGTPKWKDKYTQWQDIANTIQDYIEDSEGLQVDTVLYRGGHWDIGTKVGDVKTSPCFMSTSYQPSVAEKIGLSGGKLNTPYSITIYAPKGSKGCLTNAETLSKEFPEHEYLLGKGQKYIVLDVDDNKRTATIKLIN